MRTVQLFISFILLATYAFGQQGIKGQVLWVSGNQMPGSSKVSTAHQGIVREIHVYQASSQEQVSMENGFYTTINNSLITIVKSKKDGSFKVKLPPGTYSLFSQEKAGLFANLIDQQGFINTITVLPKKYSWISFIIDYEAAY